MDMLPDQEMFKNREIGARLRMIGDAEWSRHNQPLEAEANHFVVFFEEWAKYLKQAATCVENGLHFVTRCRRYVV